MNEPFERNDENLEIRDDGQNVSSAEQLGRQDISLQEELLEASRGQEASRQEHRNHYPSLVAALESRYGSQRQAELHRMKLRSRSRRREESLPELAEDIERLAKLAYPEATSAVLETLAKDQFIDALVDDELRLRVAQGRPATLRAALGVSLEIESFTLAAKRKTRYVRTIQGSAPEEDRSAAAGRTVTNADNMVSENKEFLAELRLMTAELRKIVSDVNQRNKVPEKSQAREKRKCWTCNSE